MWGVGKGWGEGEGDGVNGSPSSEQSCFRQAFLILRETFGTKLTIGHNPYLFFFHLQ